MKILGLTEIEQKEIENLLNPQPSVPMYNSASKGPIPIAMMHPEHRLNAAKKVICEEIAYTLSQRQDEYGVLQVAISLSDIRRETIKLLVELLNVDFEMLFRAYMDMDGSVVNNKSQSNTNPVSENAQPSIESLYNRIIMEFKNNAS